MDAGITKELKDFVLDFFIRYSARDKKIKDFYDPGFTGLDGINPQCYDYGNWLIAMDHDFMEQQDPFKIDIKNIQVFPTADTNIYRIYVFSFWHIPVALNFPGYKGIRTFFFIKKEKSLAILHQTNSLSIGFDDNSEMIYPTHYLKEQQEKIALEIEKKTQELSSVTEKLTERNKKLNAINRELENYALITAHDIKSPLSTLATMHNKFILKYGDVFDSKDKLLMEKMNHRLNDMSELIGNLLDLYSSSRSLKARNEIVDLNDLILKLGKEIQLNSDTSFSIERNGLKKINANGSFMCQLFKNLMVNSVKYADKNRPLKVIVSMNAIDEATTLFSFQDNGIGIKTKDKAKMFEFFVRQQNDTNIYGLGIGLSICKRIVELYHGKIWIDENMTVGTKFCFTLDNVIP